MCAFAVRERGVWCGTGVLIGRCVTRAYLELALSLKRQRPGEPRLSWEQIFLGVFCQDSKIAYVERTLKHSCAAVLCSPHTCQPREG